MGEMKVENKNQCEKRPRKEEGASHIKILNKSGTLYMICVIRSNYF